MRHSLVRLPVLLLAAAELPTREQADAYASEMRSAGWDVEVASCAACCAPRKLDVDVGAAWVSSASMCSRAKVGSLTSQNVSGKLLQKNGWMM